MKKIGIIILLGLFLLTGCKKNVSDGQKFKEDYESLNESARVLNINQNNPFVYTNADEIVKKIENKETFYVYFGSKSCPWCRSVIESAIKMAEEYEVKTIYYVDIWGDAHEEILRDTYELKDGKPSLVKEGTESYKKLLNYFSNVLSDYNLTSSDNKKVSVGEKRIFAPNYIYVENGEAKKITGGTSKLQTDSKMELTEEIIKEQEDLFKDFFLNSSVCTETSC